MLKGNFSIPSFYGPVLIHFTRGRTFSAISEKEKIFKKLEEVAAELEDDMENRGWTGKTITLKYKLDTYKGVFDRFCAC